MSQSSNSNTPAVAVLNLVPSTMTNRELGDLFKHFVNHNKFITDKPVGLLTLYMLSLSAETLDMVENPWSSALRERAMQLAIIVSHMKYKTASAPFKSAISGIVAAGLSIKKTPNILLFSQKPDAALSNCLLAGLLSEDEMKDLVDFMAITFKFWLAFDQLECRMDTGEEFKALVTRTTRVEAEANRPYWAYFSELMISGSSSNKKYVTVRDDLIISSENGETRIFTTDTSITDPIQLMFIIAEAEEENNSNLGETFIEL
jgi:hypothetical protein